MNKIHILFRGLRRLAYLMCVYMYTHDVNVARLVISQLVIVLIVFVYLEDKEADRIRGRLVLRLSCLKLRISF